MIKLVENDADIGRCFHVVHELRPNTDPNTFVPLIRKLMAEGYQMACTEVDGKVVCVAGFRISHNLFAGKRLYVDDLVTSDAERSKGYGKEMMEWLRNLAITHECNAFHLDSGVQRHKAHKFYLNQGMDIVCYHFLQKL